MGNNNYTYKNQFAKPKVRKITIITIVLSALLVITLAILAVIIVSKIANKKTEFEYSCSTLTNKINELSQYNNDDISFSDDEWTDTGDGYEYDSDDYYIFTDSKEFDNNFTYVKAGPADTDKGQNLACYIFMILSGINDKEQATNKLEQAKNNDDNSQVVDGIVAKYDPDTNSYNFYTDNNDSTPLEAYNTKVISNNNNFVTGKSLICVDDGFFFINKNTLYFKQNSESAEEALTDISEYYPYDDENTHFQLMSDGNIIYFLNDSYTDESLKILCSYDIHKKELNEIIESKNNIQLVTEIDNKIYYVSNHNLCVYDISEEKGTTLNENLGYYVGVARYLNHRIYFEDSDTCNIYYYDTVNESTEKFLENVCIDNEFQDKLCFYSGYVNTSKNTKSWYYYWVDDKTHEIEKSAPIPSNLSISRCLLYGDGTTTLLTSTDGECFDLFDFNLKTGDCKVINSAGSRFINKGTGLIIDKKRPYDIYLKPYSNQIQKFNGKDYDDMILEGEPLDDSCIYQYQTFVIDGYVICEEDFVWHKIKNK